MNSKTIRSANSDLATLFRKKELAPASEVFKKFPVIENLYREITTPSGLSVYLSDKANTCFLRLVETVEAYLPSRNFILPDEIYQACKKELGRMYQQERPEIEINSFLSAVDNVLQKRIVKHRFYTTLDGLNLTGVENVHIGGLTIQRPNLEILKSTIANESMIESSWKSMQKGLWVSAEITGSRDFAEKRFFALVKAACGVLSVAMTTVLERGILGVRLTPIMDGRVRPSLATWFSIEISSNELCTSSSMKGFLALDMHDTNIEGLHESEWFSELGRIIQEDHATDLESAIKRALYWFFDAQGDTTQEMQLVKFWSCIECFFSFENAGEITTKIKRGLAALLTRGSYGFVNVDMAPQLEKDIGDLYDLRSRALHDAIHSHVTDRDITTLSKWAAWTILEFTAFVLNGVKTRGEVKDKIDRLFALLQKQHSVSP